MKAAQSGLLAIIYLAFISLGLPDGVLGVAWPSMRLDLDEPLAAAGLVGLVVTACGATSGFLGGRVLSRFGTGPVVAASGMLTGLALLGFSFAPSFGWILLFAVPLGFGAGAVDTGLNHFVAEHYSARHMNWLHGCWGVGATLGPLVVGSLLAEANGWRTGYRWLAGAQLLLALCFVASLGLWRRAPQRPHTGGGDATDEAARAQARAAPPRWAHWAAPLLFLVYGTIEVGTGLWAASILVEGRGVDAQRAGWWVSCYYGSIMCGRFAIGIVAQRFGNRALVQYGLSLATVGAIACAFPGLPPGFMLLGLILLGLGCAPVYPSLMHETTRRFAPGLARSTMGRQVACASIGAALGPAVLGLLGASAGLAFIMPAVCVTAVLMAWMARRLDSVT